MDQELTNDSLIGVFLREAREAKKLTIQDVSKQLRLSEKQILALEADEFDGFASAMLARGFIKNYARLLGIDAEPLLETHRKHAPQDQVQSMYYTSETAVPLPQASRSKLITFFLIGLLLLGGLFWAVYHNLNQQDNPDQAEIVLDQNANQTSEQASGNALSGVPEQALPAAERNEAALQDANKQSAIEITNPEATVATNIEVKAPEQGSSTASPIKADVSPVAIAGGLKVTLKFTEESWVSVLDKNDKSLLNKLGHAGDVEELDGLSPLRVVIGNAHGTQLFIKNKNIDLMPYNKSNVVHITLPVE